MGLADRDYMRRSEGRDAYHDQLFNPPNSTSARPPARRGRRSLGYLLVILAVAVVGLYVLPRFAINGHHYRVWLF